MRRSTLLATMLAAGLLLFDVAASRAQDSDPYPALSRGAIDFAAASLAARSNISDLYLTAIYDFGSQTGGFSLDDGMSPQWAYEFYSPSADSIYVIAMTGQQNLLFRPASLNVYRPEAPPAPLDTSGAFNTSASFAAALLADMEFMEFRAANAGAGGPYVALQTLGPGADYMPGGSFPLDKAVWVARSGSVGDSLMVCFYATGTGQLECGMQFDRGISIQMLLSTASNVSFGMTNFGPFGGNYFQNTAGFEAPRGSGNNYVFGAGVWFGARKRVDGVLQPGTFITYNPNSGVSWATPGEGWDDRLTYSHPTIFNARAYDPNTGIPLGQGDFTWPLWVVGSDTGATYLRPGTYVALEGNRTIDGDRSRPAMVAGAVEQVVSRFSDVIDGPYEEIDAVHPFGLQFQHNMFAEPEGLDHTVIVSYDVVNRSDDTLYDAVLGMITDFDIGNSTNDGTRFYTERADLRTAVAWSGAEAGALPLGVLAMSLVEAPIVDESGFIADVDRALYRTQGTLGTYQSWTIQTDPTGGANRYAFMTAGDRDGTTSNGDYRGMLASEKFTMLPGDTAHFAIAYIVHRDLAARTGPDENLESRIESAMSAYYGLEFSGVREARSAHGTLSMRALPNPASDRVRLKIAVGAAADARVAIFDHLGELVHASDLGVLDPGEHVRTIDVAALASGSYIVVTSCGAERVSAPLVVAR